MNKIYGVLSKKNKISPGLSRLFGQLSAFFHDPYFKSHHFNLPYGYIGTCLLKNLKATDYIISKKKEGISIAIGDILRQNRGPRLLKTLLKQHNKLGGFIANEMDGIFSILLYEEKNRRLTLVNDKLGLFPLYILETEDYCLFCTNAEPLIALPLANNINVDAVAEFFSLGYILNGKTFIQGITNLAPGNMLQFQQGASSSKEYFRFSFPAIKNRSQRSIITDVDKAMKEAVKIRTANKNIHYTQLTGGFDTRFILSHLWRKNKKIIAMTGFSNNTEVTDISIARRLGRYFRLKAHWYSPAIAIEPNKMGQTDTSILARTVPKQSSFAKRIFYPTKPKNKLAILKGFLKSPIFSGLCGGELVSHEHLMQTLPDNQIEQISSFMSTSVKSYLTMKLPKLMEEEKKIHGAKNSTQERMGLFIFHVLRSYVASVWNWKKPERFFSTSTKSYPFLDINFIQSICSVPPKFLNRHLSFSILKKLHPRFVGRHAPLLLKPNSLDCLKKEIQNNPESFIISNEPLIESRRYQRTKQTVDDRLIKHTKKLSGYMATIIANTRLASKIYPDKFLIFYDWYKNNEKNIDPQMRGNK